MESHYEESINSNHEQVDQEDQENINDDIGVGRSYECVFCKRGFNTAQALGGHMNIHRKDRVRNKAAKQQEIYTGPRFYQPLLQGDHHHHSDSYAISHDHDLMSYAAYFPIADSSTTLPLLYGNNCHQYQQPSNPGYWNLGFVPKEMNQKEELDLELRLGYDS